MDLTGSHPLWEDLTPNRMRYVSLVFLPQPLLGSWPRACLSMMCTAPVLHPTGSKHRASCRPRRQLHASSCSAQGPAQFICHPCAGRRGRSSTSRSSAAVSTEEKSLCLQPWVSDQVGAGARLQRKHVVDLSISMNSLSVRSASCAFTIKLFLPKPDGGHGYYGQQLRPWEVTVPCLPCPETPQQQSIYLVVNFSKSFKIPSRP